MKCCSNISTNILPQEKLLIPEWEIVWKFNVDFIYFFCFYPVQAVMKGIINDWWEIIFSRSSFQASVTPFTALCHHAGQQRRWLADWLIKVTLIISTLATPLFLRGHTVTWPPNACLCPVDWPYSSSRRFQWTHCICQLWHNAGVVELLCPCTHFESVLYRGCEAGYFIWHYHTVNFGLFVYIWNFRPCSWRLFCDRLHWLL